MGEGEVGGKRKIAFSRPSTFQNAPRYHERNHVISYLQSVTRLLDRRDKSAGPTFLAFCRFETVLNDYTLRHNDFIKNKIIIILVLDFKWRKGEDGQHRHSLYFK